MIKVIYSYILICLLLASCESSFLDKNDEDYLIGISESKSVKLYQEGSDLYTDILDSKIVNNKERELYFTVIAKASYDIANKKRSILFSNGKSYVRFIENDKIYTYQLTNRILGKSEGVFNNLNLILQRVNEEDGNDKGLGEYIDCENCKELNDLLFKEFKCNEVCNINSYGFLVEDVFFSVFLKNESNKTTNYYKFRFDLNTTKLLSAEKIPRLAQE